MFVRFSQTLSSVELGSHVSTPLSAPILADKAGQSTTDFSTVALIACRAGY
jgi:hypothetical protein